MKLFSRESGQGEPLIILHGLFGSSDNWYTLAKTFAAYYKVYLVDQRNHGLSPHSDDFNYMRMTEDLDEFFTDHNINNAIVIGHSMGGKTAMNFAVRFPDKVKKLIIVDITPRAYPARHDYVIHGLQAINLSTLTSRTEADEILARFVPEKDERQFLLKNLSRTIDGKFEWKPDVDALSKNIGEIGKDMQYPGSYAGPSLFIRGARSSYYKPDDEANILTIFPQTKFVSIDSGHWVQAEKPLEFGQAVLDFLKS
jgi:esterase